MQRHAKVLIQVGSRAKASKSIRASITPFYSRNFPENKSPIYPYNLFNLNPPVMSTIISMKTRLNSSTLGHAQPGRWCASYTTAPRVLHHSHGAQAILIHGYVGESQWIFFFKKKLSNSITVFRRYSVRTTSRFPVKLSATRTLGLKLKIILTK